MYRRDNNKGKQVDYNSSLRRAYRSRHSIKDVKFVYTELSIIEKLILFFGPIVILYIIYKLFNI